MQKEATITFEKPGAVETWINEAGCAILDATASVILNKHGEITNSNYNASYEKGDATIILQVNVEIIYDNFTPIQLPNTDAYLPISDISVPKHLERSCGYLTAIQNVVADYADTIYCEAFGDERIQTSTLTVNSANEYTAEVDTSVSVSNSSKAGSISTASKCERFENGVYTYATDGNTYLQEDSVDQASMQDYVESLLIGTILLPEHIGSVEVVETESELQFKILPKEDFANILAQDACIMVYQNPTVLIEQASENTINNISSYLNIDKNTGIPIASGFQYTGTYTIGGIPYRLTFQADQNYYYEPLLEDDKAESAEPTEDTQPLIPE